MVKQRLVLGSGHININEINRNSDFQTTVVDQMYKEDSETEGVTFISQDVFDFLNSYPFTFDRVEAYRFFEHLAYVGSGSVGEILESLHKITNPGSTMEILVPDALILSRKLSQLESHLSSIDSNRALPETKNFTDILNDILIINTEFVNPGEDDPHQSVWTPELAKFYIEQEGTWKVSNIETPVKHQARSVYMSIECQRED